MKGFIVDRTYRIVERDGKKCALVFLFGKLANGESFLTITRFRPYFYIRKTDLERAQKLAAFNHEAVEMKSMASEPVVKIILDIPRDVPLVRKALEDSSIPCFEADIRFTQRFLMEKQIYATLDIQGEHKKGRYVGRIYEEPILTPVDYTPELAVLSIDIETSMDGESLFAISLAQQEGKKHQERTLLLKSGTAVKMKGVELFDDTHSLLQRFAALVQAWDPDIVTGWNVIDFDFADLKRRFDANRIPFILGRAEWPCALRIESAFMRDSSADFPGRMVLDGIHLMKSSFISLDDYKLETASQEFLGEGKLLKGDDRHTEIERLYQEEPKRLVEYNLKDALLVLRILEKTKLVELTALRSMLTGLTMERVRGSIASFDSVYIREMNKKGFVAPSGTFTEKAERITGGYVRESKPGIYDNIVVLDFKSMYPSVIRSFNIDPLGFLGKDEGVEKVQGREKPNTVVVAPNGAQFKNEDGILPMIIQRLWEQRDQAKKRKDKVASMAIKTLMNSFFGVLASPNCRFFSLDMANAITHFAQKFIKLAAEKVEEMGYDVIYGDTDSIFVKTGANTPDEAQKIALRIQDNINAFYEEYVKKEYKRKNFMELEAEKVYRKFLMPTVRGSDKGAKKRYAGLLVKNGGETMDFTGLEFVRRDWTEVSKEFQLELLDRIFHEREVTEYVKRFVNEVKSGEHDALLVYHKSIRKNLKDYVKTTPPHVKAARILEKKLGSLPSTIIDYVITQNGPEPLGYETAPIDYDHYIEKQIKPIADSVLGFFGTSFDDLLSGTSQQTLFKY